MGSTTNEPRGARAGQLLALLTVLLGLLAMHGLASSHHAAAAVPAHPATAGGTAVAQHAAGRQLAVDQHVAGHDHSAGAAHAPDSALAGIAGIGQPCDGDCRTELGMLCLVVLTAAAAVIVLARRRGGTPHRLRAHVRPRAPSALRRPRRALDPVAELCVSRT